MLASEHRVAIEPPSDPQEASRLWPHVVKVRNGRWHVPAELVREAQMPPLGDRLRTACKAIARVLLAVSQGRPVWVPWGRKALRLSICRACDAYRPDGRCRACGCRLKAKAALETEACPRGHW